MSEETKRKIGESNSLKNMSDKDRQRRRKSKMKQVLVHDPIANTDTIYESRDAVAKYFGVSATTVTR